MPETEKLLVTDSGTINKVNLKNTSKENIFVRSGTIFEGKGTQSRALTRSAVIFPGEEVGLDVRCVHASHGISNNAKFTYGGVTPFSVESANFTAGYRPRDQHAMWSSVNAFAGTARTFTSGAKRQRPTAQRQQPTGASVRRPMHSGRRAAAPPRGIREDAVPTRGGFVNADHIGMRFGESSRPESFVNTSSLGPNNSFLSYDSLNAADPGIQGAVADSAFYVHDDNLKASFDAFAQSFDGLLSKARLHDNQAGLALIVAAVRKVLALPFKTNLIYEHKPSNVEPPVQIFGMTAGNYVGEVRLLADFAENIIEHRKFALFMDVVVQATKKASAQQVSTGRAIGCCLN